MNEKQLHQRALDLGFFPVALDFSEPCWQEMEKHEGTRIAPSLWMRHVPSIGDEIVFRVSSETYYRGRVGKRAFEAGSSAELFGQGHEAEFYNFLYGMHLWIDQLTPCLDPAEAPLWEVDP